MRLISLNIKDTTLMSKVDREVILKTSFLALIQLNPKANVSFLYPLKTSENLKVSDVFRERERVH